MFCTGTCVSVTEGSLPVAYSSSITECLCVFVTICMCAWSACSVEIPSCFPGNVLTLLLHLLFLTLAALTIIPSYKHTRTHARMPACTHAHMALPF